MNTATKTRTKTSTPLIPVTFQVSAGKHLREIGASETEIKDLQTIVEDHIKKINTRIEQETKYAGLPSITMRRCCTHGTCNRAYINDIEICVDASSRILAAFPNITTVPVNAGVLWATMRDYSYPWKPQASTIISTFTKAQRAKVRRLFKSDFDGYIF